MKNKKLRRKIRVRSKVKGTKERPRLSVFRSNKFVYAQLINDDKGETMIGISEKQLGKDSPPKRMDKSKAMGLMMAKLAASKKIKKIVFDRNGYAYHGKVKAIAEGAREGGLEF